jgi:hypothetical protein
MKAIISARKLMVYKGQEFRPCRKLWHSEREDIKMGLRKRWAEKECGPYSDG